MPQDLSVIGFDNIELCDYVTPTLTSVNVSLRKIGAIGLQTLLQQIETGEVSHVTTIVPVDIEERQSTAPPSANV